MAQKKPIKVGVAGLTHGHVGWVFSQDSTNNISIAGIAEPNRKWAKTLSEKHGFSMDLVYDTVAEMLAATNPEAVVAFGNIYDHLAVVEACAPKGVHVMVEKPLAVNLDHAQKMEQLAKQNNIHLLTNYETSWYPTNEKAKELLDKGAIGELRKVIVRDGHRGPKKIGVADTFLDWLADPVLNGGGAITDFGCYGANLMTWLQKGKKPNTVTAVTQQLQQENNPKVDDDATVILKYDTAMAILEPSWNWPIGRKDMELYGTTGAVYADNRNQLRVRMAQGYDGFNETVTQLPERKAPFNDPFAVFAAVVKGELVLDAFDPYTLENNMITMEILDAAIRSAKEGRTIVLE